MVVAVKESYRGVRELEKLWLGRVDRYLLRGFFLRNKKTVSSNSRYLVR